MANTIKLQSYESAHDDDDYALYRHVRNYDLNQDVFFSGLDKNKIPGYEARYAKEQDEITKKNTTELPKPIKERYSESKYTYEWGTGDL